MNSKGMWVDFTEEDIELMLTIRREAEAREAKKAAKSSRPKRGAKSQTVEIAPDRKIAPKKKEIGADGKDRSPKSE
jgi:hypothetical protein